MPKSVKVAPSILAADFSRLGEEVRAVDRAGADAIHIDVMDGHFVPNLSMGVATVSSLRRWTKKCFDVHLMVSCAEPYIVPFSDAGSDIVTVHLEGEGNIPDQLARIHRLGKKAGLALNPDTAADKLSPYLDRIDQIIVMGVHPGFGGQELIPAQLEKSRVIRAMVGHRPIDIEIDGGISTANAARARAAGIDIMVAGTAVFAAADYKAAIDRLRGDPS